MQDRFSRTRLLLGAEAMERLRQARVAVFGVGGVGGYVVEALARSGVGSFELIDNDVVSESNINRQIIALTSTVGRQKTEVMRERILDINPEACVEVRNCFYLPETAGTFDFSCYSFVVDAVDTVTAKLDIVVRAQAAGIPVISCMGAGNKLDPSKFQIADIYKTSVCPLAKVMRRELKKRGVKKLTVLFSTEPPVRAQGVEDDNAPVPAEPMQDRAMATGGSQPCPETVPGVQPGAGETAERQGTQETSGPALAGRDVRRRSIPGSVAFAPSVAGLMVAAEVVRKLTQNS